MMQKVAVIFLKKIKQITFISVNFMNMSTGPTYWPVGKIKLVLLSFQI